jgi:hypothetical protein
MPLDEMNWPAPSTTETVVIDGPTTFLIRARALLASGWCRHAQARNFLGFQVSPYSRWATCWCASGAFRAAATGVSDADRRRAQARLIVAIGGETLWEFNDRQETVEPVLAAFDRAITTGGR